MMILTFETICMKRAVIILNSDELDEFTKIAHLFGEHNGSITKVAEQLFIHKNTLQYKLNKVFKKTGDNPRNFKDFVSLKMALLFYEYKKLK